jgi:hypothetical protein
MGEVKARLAARGLVSNQSTVPPAMDGVEPPVDPFSFNLDTLAAYADATKGLPVETHRAGLAGSAVVTSKKLFRRLGQIFINEAFARQTRFNEAATDSYAQLSAEIMRLRQRVESLEKQLKTKKKTVLRKR